MPPTQKDVATSISKIKDFMDNDSNIIFAFLFGSGATEKLRKESDIDISVYFVQPPAGLDLLNLVNTLSDLAGRKVDIVVLNSASVFLRHQVMKHRAALTIKDETIYRKFREKTIADYEEYNYISGMNIYDR
ncbi:MAG: nucleotidyltransferase domain-containing protein [Nitrospirae bacterium]|nr:nucleotidyltransferase domain-containing protein [Nitrospirota bacterium]